MSKIWKWITDFFSNLSPHPIPPVKPVPAPIPPPVIPVPQPAPVPDPKPVPTPVVPPRVYPVLSWDSHPDMKVASQYLCDTLRKLLPEFRKAKDITKICPCFLSLSVDDQVKALAMFIVWICYYECSWDPNDSSVDVGKKGDINTYSVGPLQLSVIDQESYKIPLGYNFSDLKDPIKNLNLGLKIMVLQIQKYGKIFIGVGEPGLYWATIHPGGQYDSSAAIIKHVTVLGLCK